MLARILIAGIVGGVLIFVMGAVNHMVLGLQGRTMSGVPEEPTFIDHLKGRNLKPGLYTFPEMGSNTEEKDQAKVYADVNERYKAGPAGLLLIAPTGEDMMSPKTLGLELATNVIAAFLASCVIGIVGATSSFGRRWLAVLLIGIIGWFSLTASYGIWYRFPHAFIHDEFLCALLEWSVAGVAIAAIVRRSAIVVAPVNT
jgi:hypothetical protein